MEVADTGLGMGWSTPRLIDRGAGGASHTVLPIARILISPPLGPPRLTPAHLFRGAAAEWSRERPPAVTSLDAWLTRLAREILTRPDGEGAAKRVFRRVTHREIEGYLALGMP